MGAGIPRARLGIARFLRFAERHLQCRHDLLRDVVLDFEDIGKFPIVTLGPDVAAARSVNQLGGDPNPISGLANAAFESEPDAELAAYLRDVERLVLVDECRIARDDEQAGDLAEIGDDVLGDSITEILLISIAAHVVEGEHDDRWPVRQRFLQLNGTVVGRRGVAQPTPNPHRTIDILHLLFSKILEPEFEAIAHLVMNGPGNVDAARIGHCLQPGRDIHPVAIDVVAVDRHIAKIDADAELDPLPFRHAGIAIGDCLLNLAGGPHRLHDARKFREQAIAHELDDAPMMLCDLRTDQLGAERLQRRQRAILVGPDQTRVANDIRSHNGGEAAFQNRILPQGECRGSPAENPRKC